MSIRTNHFKIGIFVIACVAVLIAGLVILGAGLLSPRPLLLETYLNESVRGLDIGSDVNERGVTVGRVVDIKFVPQEYNIPSEAGGHDKYGRYILIVMSVDRRKFLSGPGDPETRIAELVKAGLRFSVAQQGLTGVSRMEADYFDPQKYPAMDVPWQPKRIYIPSAPSTLYTVTEALQKALNSFNKVDFQSIGSSIDAAARSVANAATDANVPELRKNLLGLIDDARRTNAALLALLGTSKPGETGQGADLAAVLDSINKSAVALNKAIEDAKIQPLRDEAFQLMKEARETNAQLRDLASETRQQLNAADLPKVVGRFDTALRQLSAVLAGERQDLDSVLLNLRQATENLVELSDLADRYPSQVFFGGPPPKVENEK